MIRSRRWTILDNDPKALELADRLKTSPLIAQVLLNRGVSQIDDCRSFLSPSLKQLHDPELIPNLAVAAERINAAIRDREKIVIYGDYDVDGITATTILWHALTNLGGQVGIYIPHRIDEGYGLNRTAIERLCEQGTKLIITVDCGVTALDSAQAAKERGVDLIITDHHEWKTDPLSGRPILPDCHAVVHPRLPIEGAAVYPNPHLCGAGVAFKLAWRVGLANSGAARVSADFREFLIDATALAALGTIADVVPLVGENRVLAHFGLSGLQTTRLTGLRALIDSAGLTGQDLDSFHVGFLLAPRLNACGRMGHARLAVEMLTTADDEGAAKTATYLEEQNRNRQAVERKILDQAIDQVVSNGWDSDQQSALVLGLQGWHPGVIGIVASRIVDRYHRPTIMVALSDDQGQGSGRSVAGFHLASALEACTALLDGHGGHEMAAGLKLKTSNFDAFREAFCDHASRMLSPEMLIPELKIDSLAQFQQVTPALVTELKRLGPFGLGNRRPLFACRGVSVVTAARRVGKNGNHLQLQVRQDERNLRCIAFGKGELAEQLLPGVLVDLAVEPSINDFNGYRSVELEVKDLKLISQT